MTGLQGLVSPFVNTSKKPLLKRVEILREASLVSPKQGSKSPLRKSPLKSTIKTSTGSSSKKSAPSLTPKRVKQLRLSQVDVYLTPNKSPASSPGVFSTPPISLTKTKSQNVSVSSFYGTPRASKSPATTNVVAPTSKGSTPATKMDVTLSSAGKSTPLSQRNTPPSSGQKLTTLSNRKTTSSSKKQTPSSVQKVAVTPRIALSSKKKSTSLSSKKATPSTSKNATPRIVVSAKKISTPFSKGKKASLSGKKTTPLSSNNGTPLKSSRHGSPLEIQGRKASLHDAHTSKSTPLETPIKSPSESVQAKTPRSSNKSSQIVSSENPRTPTLLVIPQEQQSSSVASQTPTKDIMPSPGASKTVQKSAGKTPKALRSASSKKTRGSITKAKDRMAPAVNMEPMVKAIRLSDITPDVKVPEKVPVTPEHRNSLSVVMRSSRKNSTPSVPSPKTTPKSALRPLRKATTKSKTPSSKNSLKRKLDSLSVEREAKKLKITPESADKNKMAALVACHGWSAKKVKRPLFSDVVKKKGVAPLKPVQSHLLPKQNEMKKKKKKNSVQYSTEIPKRFKFANRHVDSPDPIIVRKEAASPKRPSGQSKLATQASTSLPSPRRGSSRLSSPHADATKSVSVQSFYGVSREELLSALKLSKKIPTPPPLTQPQNRRSRRLQESLETPVYTFSGKAKQKDKTGRKSSVKPTESEQSSAPLHSILKTPHQSSGTVHHVSIALPSSATQKRKSALTREPYSPSNPVSDITFTPIKTPAQFTEEFSPISEKSWLSDSLSPKTRFNRKSDATEGTLGDISLSFDMSPSPSSQPANSPFNASTQTKARRSSITNSMGSPSAHIATQTIQSSGKRSWLNVSTQMPHSPTRGSAVKCIAGTPFNASTQTVETQVSSTKNKDPSHSGTQTLESGKQGDHVESDDPAASPQGVSTQTNALTSVSLSRSNTLPQITKPSILKQLESDLSPSFLSPGSRRSRASRSLLSPQGSLAPLTKTPNQTLVCPTSRSNTSTPLARTTKSQSKTPAKASQRKPTNESKTGSLASSQSSQNVSATPTPRLLSPPRSSETSNKSGTITSAVSARRSGTPATTPKSNVMSPLPKSPSDLSINKNKILKSLESDLSPSFLSPGTRGSRASRRDSLVSPQASSVNKSMPTPKKSSEASKTPDDALGGQSLSSTPKELTNIKTPNTKHQTSKEPNTLVRSNTSPSIRLSNDLKRLKSDLSESFLSPGSRGTRASKRDTFQSFENVPAAGTPRMLSPANREVSSESSTTPKETPQRQTPQPKPSSDLSAEKSRTLKNLISDLSSSFLSPGSRGSRALRRGSLTSPQHPKDSSTASSGVDHPFRKNTKDTESPKVLSHIDSPSASSVNNELWNSMKEKFGQKMSPSKYNEVNPSKDSTCSEGISLRSSKMLSLVSPSIKITSSPSKRPSEELSTRPMNNSTTRGSRMLTQLESNLSSNMVTPGSVRKQKGELTFGSPSATNRNWSISSKINEPINTSTPMVATSQMSDKADIIATPMKGTNESPGKSTLNSSLGESSLLCQKGIKSASNLLTPASRKPRTSKVDSIAQMSPGQSSYLVQNNSLFDSSFEVSNTSTTTQLDFDSVATQNITIDMFVSPLNATTCSTPHVELGSAAKRKGKGVSTCASTPVPSRAEVVAPNKQSVRGRVSNDLSGIKRMFQEATHKTSYLDVDGVRELFEPSFPPRPSPVKNGFAAPTSSFKGRSMRIRGESPYGRSSPQEQTVDSPRPQLVKRGLMKLKSNNALEMYIPPPRYERSESQPENFLLKRESDEFVFPGCLAPPNWSLPLAPHDIRAISSSPEIVSHSEVVETGSNFTNNAQLTELEMSIVKRYSDSPKKTCEPQQLTGASSPRKAEDLPKTSEPVNNEVNSNENQLLETPRDTITIGNEESQPSEDSTVHNKMKRKAAAARPAPKKQREPEESDHTQKSSSRSTKSKKDQKEVPVIVENTQRVTRGRSAKKTSELKVNPTQVAEPNNERVRASSRLRGGVSDLEEKKVNPSKAMVKSNKTSETASSDNQNSDSSRKGSRAKNIPTAENVTAEMDPPNVNKKKGKNLKTIEATSTHEENSEPRRGRSAKVQSNENITNEVNNGPSKTSRAPKKEKTKAQPVEVITIDDDSSLSVEPQTHASDSLTKRGGRAKTQSAEVSNEKGSGPSKGKKAKKPDLGAPTEKSTLKENAKCKEAEGDSIPPQKRNTRVQQPPEMTEMPPPKKTRSQMIPAQQSTRSRSTTRMKAKEASSTSLNLENIDVSSILVEAQNNLRKEDKTETTQEKRPESNSLITSTPVRGKKRLRPDDNVQPPVVPSKKGRESPKEDSLVSKKNAKKTSRRAKKDVGSSKNEPLEVMDSPAQKTIRPARKVPTPEKASSKAISERKTTTRSGKKTVDSFEAEAVSPVAQKKTRAAKKTSSNKVSPKSASPPVKKTSRPAKKAAAVSPVLKSASPVTTRTLRMNKKLATSEEASSKVVISPTPKKSGRSAKKATSKSALSKAMSPLATQSAKKVKPSNPSTESSPDKGTRGKVATLKIPKKKKTVHFNVPPSPQVGKSRRKK